MPVATVEPRELRAGLCRFGTGVCVVTVSDDGEPHGLTVNAFTAVSLEPPLVLVSIAKRARGHELLVGAEFVVNVLGAEQETVARHFSGDPHPAAVRWAQGEQPPRLEDALATFVCRPWRSYAGGDHTLFLGQVVELDYRDGDALGFVHSRFTTLPTGALGIEHIFG
jgi:flavin reductase (DIM6/NTAB) family NADH-FMN oxidoreductase RutF